MAAIGSKALSIVGEPDGGSVVLGAGEEKVPISVVLEKGEGPLVPFHQNWPHLVRVLWFRPSKRSRISGHR